MWAPEFTWLSRPAAAWPPLGRDETAITEGAQVGYPLLYLRPVSG